MLSLLSKPGLLREVDQVSFALLLQPGVGHDERYE
jgi:hypothetical protein